MKYSVIATCFTNGKQDRIILADFNTFANASIFKEAYNEKYKTNCYIVERS